MAPTTCVRYPWSGFGSRNGRHAESDSEDDVLSPNGSVEPLRRRKSAPRQPTSRSSIDDYIFSTTVAGAAALDAGSSVSEASHESPFPSSLVSKQPETAANARLRVTKSFNFPAAQNGRPGDSSGGRGNAATQPGEARLSAATNCASEQKSSLDAQESPTGKPASEGRPHLGTPQVHQPHGPGGKPCRGFANILPVLAQTGAATSQKKPAAGAVPRSATCGLQPTPFTPISTVQAHYFGSKRYEPHESLDLSFPLTPGSCRNGPHGFKRLGPRVHATSAASEVDCLETFSCIDGRMSDTASCRDDFMGYPLPGDLVPEADRLAPAPASGWKVPQQAMHRRTPSGADGGCSIDAVMRQALQEAQEAVAFSSSPAAAAASWDARAWTLLARAAYLGLGVAERLGVSSSEHEETQRLLHQLLLSSEQLLQAGDADDGLPDAHAQSGSLASSSSPTTLGPLPPAGDGSTPSSSSSSSSSSSPREDASPRCTPHAPEGVEERVMTGPNGGCDAASPWARTEGLAADVITFSPRSRGMASEVSTPRSSAGGLSFPLPSACPFIGQRPPLHGRKEGSGKGGSRFGRLSESDVSSWKQVEAQSHGPAQRCHPGRLSLDVASLSAKGIEDMEPDVVPPVSPLVIEREAMRQLKMVEAVVEAHEIMFADESLNGARVGTFLLGKLLDFTGSKMGFVASLCFRAEDGAEYLRTCAITNVGWTPELRQWYSDNQESGLVFHDMGTLFGQVVRTSDVVISNEPRADSRSRGLPPGHPAVDTFLGVPLLAGGELVGMYAVANREDGYSEDMLEELQPFTKTVAQIVAEVRRRGREGEECMTEDGSLWRTTSTPRPEMIEEGEEGEEREEEAEDDGRSSRLSEFGGELSQRWEEASHGLHDGETDEEVEGSMREGEPTSESDWECPETACKLVESQDGLMTIVV